MAKQRIAEVFESGATDSEIIQGESKGISFFRSQMFAGD